MLLHRVRCRQGDASPPVPSGSVASHVPGGRVCPTRRAHMSCQLVASSSVPVMDRQDEIALARWEDDGGAPARPPRFSTVSCEPADASQTIVLDTTAEE